MTITNKKRRSASESIGERFGRLVCTDIQPVEKGKDRKAVFNCDCGTKGFVARLDSIRSGNTKSCGCLSEENLKRTGKKVGRHGMTGTPTYKSWQSMKQRVKPDYSDSKDYFDRGIIIEDKRWLNFIEFFNDMGERPDGTSLDRIDNDMGYFKENCRWATPKQQVENRRTPIMPKKFDEETRAKVVEMRMLHIPSEEVSQYLGMSRYAVDRIFSKETKSLRDALRRQYNTEDMD